MTRDEHINDFLGGRTFMVLAAICLTLVSLFWSGLASGEISTTGIFFSLKLSESFPTMLATAINLAAILAIGGATLLLNKMFNFVRTYTFIFVSMFFLLEAASPATAAMIRPGTALCIVAVAGVLPLFASYENTQSQGRIFLTMAILAAMCLFQWTFLVLIPAFFIGFIQMRTMHLRGVLAAMLGLITPFWIVVGLGLVNPVADFHPFEVSSLWEHLQKDQLQLLVAWTSTVAVLSIILTVMNLFTIINYRLQFRVYNAFFMTLNVLVIIAMAADYKDLSNFLPLLNLCLAVQIAHWFTLRNHPKRHLLIFAIIAAVAAVGVCTVVL